MKRNFLITLAFSLVSIVILTSCEKVLISKDKDYTARGVFEFLWDDINNRYSFFEEKEIDWQAVKEAYSPLITDETDAFELFDILGDMLAELRDGHVNLLSTFNRSRNWEWFENYPANYNEQLIFNSYLRTDYRIIGPLNAQTVDGNMLYVSCRSFERTIENAHMDEVIRLMQFHDGLIIDIRNNGGGNLGNALNIAARLTDKQFNYALQRFKTGPGSNDFTPWISLSVSPRQGDKYLSKVAVLTNRRSYSTSTFFAQMMKELPQARIFGDQTGGGGGTPAFAELPNGWRYRFSASQTVNLDDEHLEFGVKADEFVELNPADELNGLDSVIEAAIEWLKN